MKKQPKKYETQKRIKEQLRIEKEMKVGHLQGSLGDYADEVI